MYRRGTKLKMHPGTQKKPKVETKEDRIDRHVSSRGSQEGYYVAMTAVPRAGTYKKCTPRPGTD
jgi:hypothetical protein